MQPNKEELHVRTEIVSEDTNTVVHTLSYLFTRNTGSGGNSNNDFELQITDPENPLLLFDYKLSPFDFPRLKEELTLNCEFSGFPGCIHDILTECNENSEFKAVLDCKKQEPIMRFQQMTKISLLTPVKLTLIPASDQRIKEYLSNETKFFKQQFERTVEELRSVQEAFESSKNTANGKANELKKAMENQKAKYQAELEKVSQEHDDYVERLKSENAAAIETQRQAFEETRDRLLSEQKKSEDSLRAQLSTALSEKHQSITQCERQSERINALEAQLRESKQRIESGEAETKKLLGEQQELQTANSALQTELASLKAKHEGLQHSFQEKTEYAANTDNTVSDLRQLLKEKEAIIESLNQQLKETKKRADERDWIADKSKKVISKHQEDLRKLIERHNAKKAQWESREAHYREVEKNYIRLQETEKQLQQQIESLNGKLDESKEQNNELQKQIDELTKKITDDKVLVDYLQKSLNEKKIEEIGDDEYQEDDNLLTENSMALSNGFSTSGQASPMKKGSPARNGYVPESYNFPQTSSLFENVPFY